MVNYLLYLKKICTPYGLTAVQVKRIIRATICAIIADIFNFTKPIERTLGIAPYIMLIMAVTLHPGRRLGKMIETSILTISGMLVGIGYTCLCIYIARVIEHRATDQASLGFLVVAEVLMLFTHGIIRSISERLFPFAFLMFVVCHFAFLGTTKTTTLGDIAKGYAVPVLLGDAFALICSLVIFPEFGSTALGSTTVGAIDEMNEYLVNVVRFFVQESPDDLTLAALQKGKQKLATKLGTCKDIFTETAYEVSYAYMSPTELRPFLKTLYRSATTINALIGACESEYALLSHDNSGTGSSGPAPNENSSNGDSRPSPSVSAFGSGIRLNHHLNNVGSSSAINLAHPSVADFKNVINFAKPEREIEHGSRALLLKFLGKVRLPVLDLLALNTEALDKLKMAISVAYDVPATQENMVGSFWPKNKGCNVPCSEQHNITVESIDKIAGDISRHLEKFDQMVPNILERISLNANIEQIPDDLLPRDEYFLLTLFLLNFREYSSMMIQELIHARVLLLTRREREQRKWLGRRLWLSKISSRKAFLKFLSVGRSDVQESDLRSTHSGIERSKTESRVQKIHSKDNKEEEDKPMEPKSTKMLGISGMVNWLKRVISKISVGLSMHEEHLKFGFKFTLLLMIVSFPGFSVVMRKWYTEVRGTWVGFVATLTLEPSLGGTTRQFIIRAVGLVLGSSWGYVSYVTGWTDTAGLVVMVVMMSVGYVFGYYYLIVSPYPKAALIGIVSCSVVVQGTVVPTIPGTIAENFAKRCLAMMVGGAAAMLVQVVVFPVRARDELVKHVVKAIRLCEYIDAEISILEYESPDSSEVLENYTLAEKACKEARRVIRNAEKFRELARREPRLKGSFRYRSMVYREVIFVLDQIVDRFDNVIFLRKQYGSVVLSEELYKFVRTYRLEFYGSVISTLKSIEQSLMSKTPLPQYLPSSRISHVRLVNRVREALLSELPNKADNSISSLVDSDTFLQNNVKSLESMVYKKYMGWSATSVAFEQVIELLEELIELAKLLVGEDEFRYGYLSRPLDQKWTLDVLYGNPEEALRMLNQQQMHVEPVSSRRSLVTEVDPTTGPPIAKIDTFDFGAPEQFFDEHINDTLGDIPLTLRKIASRRTRTNSLSHTLPMTKLRNL